MKAAVSSLLCVCAFVIGAMAANPGTIVYSTQLPGVSLTAIAVDRGGNVYVTGYGSTPGIFVAELNPKGKVVYSTYIGGVGNIGSGIAVDWNGNAYVTGTTGGGLPTTPKAFQSTPPQLGGPCGWFSDPFVLKVNSKGKVVYATYLAGQVCINSGIDIAVDLQGNAYVTGLTTGDFPTTPSAINADCSEFCGFVAKLDTKGRSLLYSDYLGNFDVYPWSIAVDLLGQAYVTGSSYMDFVTTPNAFEPNWPGGFDNGYEPFVVKLNDAGNSFVYSTYLGGKVCDSLGYCASYGAGRGIAVDLQGNAYVVGATEDGFPSTPNSVQPMFGGAAGGVNGFATKLDPAGNSLVYSTYIGSTGTESATDIAVDLLGNAYVVWGSSGALDAQVARLNAGGSSLVNLGTGNQQYSWSVRIAADYSRNIYVATFDGSVIKIVGR